MSKSGNQSKSKSSHEMSQVEVSCTDSPPTHIAEASDLVVFTTKQGVNTDKSTKTSHQHHDELTGNTGKKGKHKEITATQKHHELSEKHPNNQTTKIIASESHTQTAVHLPADIAIELQTTPTVPPSPSQPSQPQPSQPQPSQPQPSQPSQSQPSQPQPSQSQPSQPQPSQPQPSQPQPSQSSQQSPLSQPHGHKINETTMSTFKSMTQSAEKNTPSNCGGGGSDDNDEDVCGDDDSDDQFDTKKYKQMGLVDECDVKEMESVLKDNPKLKEIFKSSDDLIHALKVISLIRPNEKFSTSAGIFIQSEIQNPTRVSDWIRQYTQPLWFIRMRNGDDRITNLKAIKAIFVGAFVVVDDALQEHENFSRQDSQTRVDIVKKLKNEQLINRMAEAITKAMNSLENLKQTYIGDANACARIDMLRETVKDRSTLIKTSLDFLK